MRPRIVTQLMTEDTNNSKYRITFYSIKDFNERVQKAPNYRLNPLELFRYAMVTCPEQEVNVVADTEEDAISKFRVDYPEKEYEIIEIAKYTNKSDNLAIWLVDKRSKN